MTGMPLGSIVSSFETGMGNTLGHIAIVVGLGTMLGKMMAESGASDRIADTLIQPFGERRVPWSMMCAGLIVGLPVFFEVGFVLLVPIAFTVARRTRTSLILVGLPMVAGLSVVHALIPPHPAAMLAVTIFHADVGRTILYAPAGRHSLSGDCRAALCAIHRSPDCARRTQPDGGAVRRA